MSKQFVSQIPKNKLEPVFLGGGSGANLKTAAQSSGGSGVYVPAHLRGNNVHAPQSSVSMEKKTKPVSLDENNFPGLPTKKTTPVATKPTMNYAEMAKKVGVVQEPIKFKPVCPPAYQYKRDTRNWGDQEEEFDFEDYDEYEEEEQ